MNTTTPAASLGILILKSQVSKSAYVTCYRLFKPCKALQRRPKSKPDQCYDARTQPGESLCDVEAKAIEQPPKSTGELQAETKRD